MTTTTIRDSSGIQIRVGDRVRVVSYGWALRLQDTGREAEVVEITARGLVRLGSDEIARGFSVHPECLSVLDRTGADRYERTRLVELAPVLGVTVANSVPSSDELDAIEQAEVDYVHAHGTRVPARTEVVTLANPHVCGAYVHNEASQETGACRCGQPGVTTTRQQAAADTTAHLEAFDDAPSYGSDEPDAQTLADADHALQLQLDANRAAIAQQDAARLAQLEQGIPSSSAVVTAAVAVAELFVDALGFGLAEHFSCKEAETVAQLIRLVHGEEEAQSFLADHGSSDENPETTDTDDKHYALHAALFA